MEKIDEATIRNLLQQKRKYMSEYAYLRSKHAHGNLSSEQTQHMRNLGDWLGCINSLLLILNEDEIFVIQRHVLDEIDWNRIIAEYETRWGIENRKCQRTLIRYQKNALLKLARRLETLPIPDLQSTIAE